MNLNDALEVLKDEYPKANKPALSMAMRTDETGVTLSPKAKRMIYGPPKPRSKPCALKVRVTPEDRELIHAEMDRLGCQTEQDFLAYLLDTVIHPTKREWLPSEDESHPTMKKGSEKR